MSGGKALASSCLPGPAAQRCLGQREVGRLVHVHRGIREGHLHRGEARVTVSVVVRSDRAHRLNATLERVAELEPARMPLIDPDPVQRTRVASAAPPAHFEQAVERAVERIRAAYRAQVDAPRRASRPERWDGHAAERIAKILAEGAAS